MSYTSVSGRSLGQPSGGSTRAPYCSDAGNATALQQMLTDLGYYLGPIDGVMSPGGPTYQAAQAFARSEGFDQYAPIGTAYCERLIERWEQQRSSATTPPVPNGGSSTGIDPRVFRTRYLASQPSTEAALPPEEPLLDSTSDRSRTYAYVGAGVLGLIIIGGLGYYVLTKKKNSSVS